VMNSVSSLTKPCIWRASSETSDARPLTRWHSPRRGRRRRVLAAAQLRADRPEVHRMRITERTSGNRRAPGPPAAQTSSQCGATAACPSQRGIGEMTKPLE
jgi:hypothetical protein